MKAITKKVWRFIRDKNPKYSKKEFLLIISFLAILILLVVLPSIYWTSTYRESLVASVISVILTLFIAYFFIDRYRRERDRKERERRKDIQKEILDGISQELTFLIQGLAFDFEKCFKQPAPVQETLLFKMFKTHNDFNIFITTLENEVLKLELIDIDKFNELSFYGLVFGIDQFTENISREMLYHQGTLDDLRPVIRIFNHFQHTLNRCMTKMEMYTHGYKPKDISYKEADLSELMYLCRTIIKILRAIDDTVVELKLGERKTGVSDRYFSPQNGKTEEGKTENTNQPLADKSVIINRLADQLKTVFIVDILSLYLGAWTSKNIPKNDIIADGAKWYYYVILTIISLLCWVFIYRRKKSSANSRLSRWWVPCFVLAGIWLTYYVAKLSVPTWLFYLITGLLLLWALFIITNMVFASRQHWSEGKLRSKAIKLAMRLGRSYLMLVLAEMFAAILTTWAALLEIDEQGWWMPLMPYLLIVGILIVFGVWLIMVRTYKESD